MHGYPLEPVLGHISKKNCPADIKTSRSKILDLDSTNSNFVRCVEVRSWSCSGRQSVPWVVTSGAQHSRSHWNLLYTIQRWIMKETGPFQLFCFTIINWRWPFTATCSATFKFLCCRMSDLIMPFEGKDLESSSTTTNNKTKDAIEWELNEDKRAAREKSLWYVLSYEHNAYPKIDLFW